MTGTPSILVLTNDYGGTGTSGFLKLKKQITTVRNIVLRQLFNWDNTILLLEAYDSETHMKDETFLGDWMTTGFIHPHQWYNRRTDEVF